jgi:NADH-quinone oxidoreductase subunit H
MRILVLQGKILAVILFFMWVRWSWPRFRFDQLMNLAWKIMLPLGIVNLITMAILYEARQATDPRGTDLGWTLCIAAVSWIVFVAAWLVTALSNPLVTDNRPRRYLSPLGADAEIGAGQADLEAT